MVYAVTRRLLSEVPTSSSSRTPIAPPSDRQTGELLVRRFAQQFGVNTPFFHGGLNQEQRADIVRLFQSDDGPKCSSSA
ncbi:hypothetical protein ACIBI9_52930 [Nonomuraea sp. NPDC050451]|uniref:hypothetical protein n=1 Tax=Nonomuraea sp. NPDC050451 TaxID=3364364 RepID=UPI0037905BEB